jgi:hypothetical protein
MRWSSDFSNNKPLLIGYRTITERKSIFFDFASYSRIICKEGKLNLRGGAFILIFIRNETNLAQFFRQMPMRQKLI